MQLIINKTAAKASVHTIAFLFTAIADKHENAADNNEKILDDFKKLGFSAKQVAELLKLHARLVKKLNQKPSKKK